MNVCDDNAITHNAFAKEKTTMEAGPERDDAVAQRTPVSIVLLPEAMETASADEPTHLHKQWPQILHKQWPRLHKQRRTYLRWELHH